MLSRMGDPLGKIRSLAHKLTSVWQEADGVVILEVASIWHFYDDSVIETNACSVFTIADGK